MSGSEVYEVRRADFRQPMNWSVVEARTGRLVALRATLWFAKRLRDDLNAGRACCVS